MPQLDIICPMITKAIKDERDAVKSYRFLLDQIVPIADEIEIETGTGSEILDDIGNIIEDQIRHERIFTHIHNRIGCKGRGLSFLLERKS